jgi:hypothetical protein
VGRRKEEEGDHEEGNGTVRDSRRINYPRWYCQIGKITESSVKRTTIVENRPMSIRMVQVEAPLAF